MKFQPTTLKYKNDDRPSAWPMLMYGLQWFLVTVPIIIVISSVIGSLQFHDLAERTFYTQKLFGIMGVGLFVQVLFGHKMPVVIGPASVLLIGIITSQTSQLSDIYTAVICGGALLFLISYSPWMNFLKGIFTSRIVIVILALIAFTLTPTILGLLFTGQPQPFLVLCLSLGIVFIMLLGNKFLRGVWKSSIVLWGLIIGTVCYVLIFGVQGIAMANSDGVTDSGFLLSGLSFNPGIFLSFLFCYIALFINELGSVQSVGTAINVDHLDRRTKMGLRITGLMNILSGGMGVVGPVDYSMSPGVIMSTGCASRYTLLPAAGLLVLCAFFPGVVSMFAAIPRPVMGIILLYLMSTQISSAFQLIVQREALPDFDSCMIVAFPLMVAIVISFMPSTVVTSIPPILRPLLANGFVMGVITVLVMEHLVFRKKSHK
jgi:Xanthine/uracil permeases